MGSLSNYSENELLDHLLGTGEYTPPATVYLGYSTADPTDDGSGLAEPSSGNYSRKAVTFNAAASRALDNQRVICWLMEHWRLKNRSHSVHKLLNYL